MNNNYIERKNTFFHRLLGVFRGYATINYSHPHSRLARIEMERKVKNRDLLYVFFGMLILVGIFKNIGDAYKSNIPQAIQAMSPPKEVKAKEPEVKFVEVLADDRTGKLKAFLESKNSPMAPYAGVIVKEADEHGIDWTLIVSISAMESNYGIRIPEGSHNAWGIKGKDVIVRRFASWNESIAYVSALLGNNYRLNMLKGIKDKYCPDSDGCNKKWVTHVSNSSEAILATKVKQ